MTRWLLLLLLLLSPWVWTPHDAKAAGCEVRTDSPTYSNLTVLGVVPCNSQGSINVNKTTLDAGEDQPNNVLRVETQNTYQTPVTTDTLVKTGAAYVKWMSCAPTDNAAVAGTIQLRDATAAGAGTIVVEWTVLAIDYTVNVPKVFPVDSLFTTGVYLDFTTTSDVKCWLSYR